MNYVDADFSMLLQALKDKIQHYLPEWTDNNDSDFGIALLQLFSHVADILYYYLNRRIGEVYLPSAVQRESVINLLRLIDYNLSSASPATVILTFTLSLIDIERTITAGAQVSSPSDNDVGSVYFETDENLVLPVGTATSYIANNLVDSGASFHVGMVGWSVKNTVTEQSDIVTVFVSSTQLTFGSDLFPTGNESYGFIAGKVTATEGKSGDEVLGDSDGTAYQKFTISDTPIIDGSLVVSVDGTPWTIQESLALSESTDEHFYTQRDSDDVITVLFGDDVNGKIPANSLEITCEYRIGGGIAGNLSENTITIMETTFPFTASVNNDLAAEGGLDRETIANAKVQGPLSLRTLNRAVTVNDYEVLSEGYPGVARAKTVQSEVFSYRNVSVHIVPDAGGLPSQALKDNLEAYLDTKRMVNDVLAILDPDYVTVDIEATVYYEGEYLEATVSDAVNSLLESFFGVTSLFVDFGKNVNRSDIYRAIEDLEGVDHVDIEKLYRVPAVKGITGSLDTTGVITSIAISAITKEETWSIIFIDATNFNVTGSVSGDQANTGTVDVAYSSDNNEISFIVNTGIETIAIDDKAEIKTSKQYGNVALSDEEFPKQGMMTLDYLEA